MRSVPVIDISGLRGDLSQRREVGRQIDKACSEIGFLCITGHGVDPALIERVRAAALAFFDLPEAAKMAIDRKPPGFRGYIPLASEGLARSAGDAAAAADLKEAFSMGTPLSAPAGADSAAAAAYFAPNLWPAGVPELRAALEEYYFAAAELAEQLLGGFALALGIDEDWFADKVDRHISNLRALHYPAQERPPAPGQIRAGAHTDYGCLTILLTEDAPGGLEVRGPDGEWRPVPHVPGSFVVNIGDLMARWSNDRYRSTPHRVSNPPGGTGARRMSIAFFHQPNYDAEISCLPNCAVAGEAPKYPPITSGEHRLEKVQKANAAATAMG